MRGHAHPLKPLTIPLTLPRLTDVGGGERGVRIFFAVHRNDAAVLDAQQLAERSDGALSDDVEDLVAGAADRDVVDHPGTFFLRVEIALEKHSRHSFQALRRAS